MGKGGIEGSERGVGGSREEEEVDGEGGEGEGRKGGWRKGRRDEGREGTGAWRGGRGGLAPAAPCDALSSPGSPGAARRGAEHPRGRGAGECRDGDGKTAAASHVRARLPRENGGKTVPEAAWGGSELDVKP